MLTIRTSPHCALHAPTTNISYGTPYTELPPLMISPPSFGSFVSVVFVAGRQAVDE